MSNSQIAKVAKESGADHARSQTNGERQREREREGHRTAPCEASIVPLQVIMHRPRTPRRQQYIQITDVWATGHRASRNTRCSHLPNPSPSHKHTQDEAKHIRPQTSHSCHGTDHRHPQSSNQSVSQSTEQAPNCSTSMWNPSSEHAEHSKPQQTHRRPKPRHNRLRTFS